MLIYFFFLSYFLSFFFFFFFFCRSTKINEIEEFMANFVFKPIKSSLGVLWHSPKRLFLLIQIINCTIYWFANDEQNILYFYMTRRFDKFTGGDFAIYTIATKVWSTILFKLFNWRLWELFCFCSFCKWYNFPFFQILGIFGLLVVIPLLNKYLKLHESLMMLIITSSTAVSVLGSTLVKDLFPGFYLVRAIGFLRPSTLAVARSLLAMTVDNVQEIGRIYAITGFISAILPFVSNPSYR